MKKSIVLMSLLLIAPILSAGVEFLGVDGVPTSYVANTGALSMGGSSLVITVDYNDGSPQSSISPASFLLTTSRVSGSHFEGGTFSFSDATSVLLSGDVISVDFQEVYGLLGGSGQAEVLVENLEGNLLGFSEIVTITFNINPPSRALIRMSSGLSKVNFLVPEPEKLSIWRSGRAFLSGSEKIRR
jgi:hypothetical protein